MRRILLGLTGIAAAAAAGCYSNATVCKATSDCPNGWYCNDKKSCTQDCTSDAQCAYGKTCDEHGQCQPYADGEPDAGLDAGEDAGCPLDSGWP